MSTALANASTAWPAAAIPRPIDGPPVDRAVEPAALETATFALG